MIGEPLDGASLDIASAKRDALRALFPEAMTEGGTLDVEMLKLALGEAVNVGKERYGLTWPGRAACFKSIQSPSMATLLPLPEKSVNFDTTDNVIVEGDNLEVLKLLQKSYLGAIKMIYIDPPYNTGNDFIYPDDYSESLKTYLEFTGQSDPEGRKFGTNPDSDGRFHSKWLSMMYPRIYLARNLLREDGIMFVSIDDNELTNLKALCDSVFGSDCFVATFVWVKKKKGSHLSKAVRSMTEYVLCYASTAGGAELFGEAAYADKWQPLAKRTNAKKTLTFPTAVVETTLPDGTYVANKYGEGTSALTFVTEFQVTEGRITTPLSVSGPFVWGQDMLDRELSLGTRVALSKKYGFNVLRHDQEDKIKRPSTLLDSSAGAGTNEDAYEELKNIFGIEALLQYPKPSSMIKLLVRAACFADPNAIVLDFFAGSGTTADAVMQLNAEDDGQRRFLLVQLPEPTNRQDYPTIADICEERVRRSIAALAEREETNTSPPLNEASKRRGFRVFKLAESNVEPWNAGVTHESVTFDQQLALHVAHLRSDRSDIDILYEVLLKEGFKLSSPVATETVVNKTLYSVADGAFIVCLDRNLDLELLHAIAERKPERVLLLDDGFSGHDQLKTNAVQTFRSANIVLKTL